MGRRSKTTVTFRVKLAVPTGSNIQALTEYVRDALKSHRGGLDPQDPLFEVNEPTVSLLKRETIYE